MYNLTLYFVRTDVQKFNRSFFHFQLANKYLLSMKNKFKNMKLEMIVTRMKHERI